MPVGRVKWFDNRKGWGFLVQPDGSDLFVHYSSIVGEGFKRLDDGATVEYEVEQGPKGLQAGNVRPVGAPAKEVDSATAPPPAPHAASEGQETST